MSIAQNLAKLHSSYGVYSSESLHTNSGNILVALKSFSVFEYLSSFYDEYKENFTETKTKSFEKSVLARSRDLFFIGENVIKTNETRFFFVFEGSLSSVEKLSITVLAHLWLLDDNDPIINEFCGNGKWWNTPAYLNIKNRLTICPDFAKNSYVTDAVRLQSTSNNSTNIKNNRELLYKEIEILKPKLVICVGKTAKEIVGMKYLDQETKFHYVRFPKYHNEVEGYEELSKIMASIDF